MVFYDFEIFEYESALLKASERKRVDIPLFLKYKKYFNFFCKMIDF